MKRLTIEIHKDLFNKLKIYCINNNITLKEYITDLIINDIK